MKLIPIATALTLVGPCSAKPWKVDDPWAEVAEVCGEREQADLWEAAPLDLSEDCRAILFDKLHVVESAWADVDPDTDEPEIALAEAIYALGTADAGMLSDLEPGGPVHQEFINTLEIEAADMGVDDAPVSELLFRNAARFYARAVPYEAEGDANAQYGRRSGTVSINDTLAERTEGRMYWASVLLHEARHARQTHVLCPDQDPDERAHCDSDLGGANAFQATWFFLLAKRLDNPYSALQLGWTEYDLVLETPTSVSPLQERIDALEADAIFDVPDGVHVGTLTTSRPLTLRGGPGAVLRAGDGPAIWATAPLRIEGLTLDDGFHRDAWGVLGEDDVTLLWTRIVDGGGLGDSAVLSRGDLDADGILVDVQRGGNGLILEGTGTLTVRNSVLTASYGSPARGYDASGTLIEDTEVNGAFTAGGGGSGTTVVRRVSGTGSVRADGDDVTVEDVHIDGWLVSLGIASHITDVTATGMQLDAESGTATDLRTASLALGGLDAERVLIEGDEYPGIWMRDASLRGAVVRAPAGDFWTYFVGDNVIEGLVVDDAVGESAGWYPALDGSGRVELSHVTWIGGDRRWFGFPTLRVTVTDSLIAGTRFRESEPGYVTAIDTYGWGDDLPFPYDTRLPWERVDDTLDGLDLPADSPLLIGGHPGAMGGDYAADILELWE